jgi:type IV secretion system protein VirB10
VVGQPVADDSYAEEWEQYRQAQAQVRQEKTQAARSALQAPPAVSFGENAGQGSAAGGMAGGAPGFVPPSMDAGVRERMERVAQLAAAAQGGAGEPDPNNATGKRDWLASEPDPVNYLDRGRAAPVSPYELKTGAVIPSTMIGGINSDLPGTIIGQVRENVWDTATGQHCLIPQGARLVGTYDNQVTRGQSRVLVAWNRIIYPNGSSLDIGSMPGSDSAGYAGFKDKTNNHYWRVFGDALMMSVFAAGIQLSQPESSAIDGGYDSQQIIAGSLGQQLGQAGMQITQKNLSIQPTLEIRPGYRFNIMVTKDIVLSPWEGGCSS